MDKQYNQLVDDILKDYHEKIYETVPFSDLGDFMTELLVKYKELHPYKKPHITKIADTTYIDLGDFNL